MKTFLQVLLILVGCNYIHAQDKQATMEGMDPSDFSGLSLGKEGLVVAIQKDNEFTMRHFGAEVDLVWEAKTERHYNGKPDRHYMSVYDMVENFMVSTPSGSWVYHVEMKPGDYYKKDHYITQVSKQGQVKKFTVEGREELGNSLQTVFCDNRYFYFLATDNGDETSKNKKAKDVLILNRFDAKDFSYKRIVLELPAIEPGENTTFWKYLGQTETEKLLVSKNIDYPNGKIVFTIAAFNDEGKVVRTLKIEPQLKGAFIRPARIIKPPFASFHQVSEFNYFPKVTPGSPHTDSHVHVEPTNGGFCSIQFDEVSKSFHVFGLSGPKPFRRVGPVYNGFYVMKYDVDGKSQWYLQQAAPKSLMDESFFRVHAFPGLRNISLRSFPDQMINFSIQFKQMVIHLRHQR
jgi:hypothetical protein